MVVLDNRRLRAQHSETMMCLTTLDNRAAGKVSNWSKSRSARPFWGRRSALIDYHVNMVAPEMARRGTPIKTPIKSADYLPPWEQGFRFWECVTWEHVLADALQLIEKHRNDRLCVQWARKHKVKTRIIEPTGHLVGGAEAVVRFAASRVYKNVEPEAMDSLVEQLMADEYLYPPFLNGELNVKYSKQAKKLAVAVKKTYGEVTLPGEEAVAAPGVVPESHLPSEVPLDRRPTALDIMTDEELARALDQALARVNRISTDDANYVRYMSYLDACKLERVHRQASETENFEIAPDTPEEEGSYVRAAITNLPEPDEEPALLPDGRPRFRDFPEDTPESI